MNLFCEEEHGIWRREVLAGGDNGALNFETIGYDGQVNGAPGVARPPAPANEKVWEIQCIRREKL